MLKHLKLGARISLITGLVVLIAFGATTWILSTTSSRLARQQSFNLAESVASENANRVDAMLEVGMDAMRTLAHVFEALKAADQTDRPMCDEILRQVLQENPEFLAVWTCWEPNAFDGRDASYVNRPGTDATGRYVPYWNRAAGSIRLEPLIGYNVPGEGDYYLLAKMSNQETITPPYVYKAAGEDVLMTSLVVPIRHNGTFVGACGVDIQLKTIQGLVAQIRPQGTGFAALISNNGRYAAHPDATALNADLGSAAVESQMKSAARAGRPLHLTRAVAGREYYSSMVPLVIGQTRTPWAFLVNIPMDTVLAPAREVRNTVLLIGAMALLGVFIVLYPVNRRLVSAPVTVVTGVAEQIAAGNLIKARDDLREIDAAARARRDEIGRLLDAFEAMIGNLSSLADQVQRSVVQVSSSTVEIASATRQLEASSHEQVASAREVSATTREISGISDRLVLTMDNVSKDLSGAVEQAAQGRDSLQNMEAAMSQLVTATKSISSSLATINIRAKRISEVVNAINKISERTNLLSLNAAIESEKAGEYGKGFGVVAREISRLADQTAIATHDIASVIQEMQSSVSAGVMEVEKFSDEVSRRTEEVARIGTQLTSLIDEVQELRPQFTSITSGMHDQSTGAQQISEAIAQLSATADQTRQSVVDFRQVTENLNAATQALQQEVGRFKITQAV